MASKVFSVSFELQFFSPSLFSPATYLFKQSGQLFCGSPHLALAVGIFEVLYRPVPLSPIFPVIWNLDLEA